MHTYCSLDLLAYRRFLMEYMMLTAALLLGIAVILIKKVYDQKKTERWLLQTFRTEFGKQNEKIPDREVFYGITGYFRHHQVPEQIDAITCNDLELDKLFFKINTAKSSAGQEYLYYLLRTPSFSQEELACREDRINFWITQETLRTKMQMIFYKLGKTGKYSIFDYMEFLDSLKAEGNGQHILCCILFGAAFLLLFLQPALGIACLCGVAAYNISTYLKKKKEIVPYLISFRYVLRSLETTRKILSVKEFAGHPFFAEKSGRLQTLLKQFEKFDRSSWLGMHVMGEGSNPLDLIWDYLNMLFHLDLMGFGVMLKQLRSHRTQIDEVISILGETEALIAVASYRMSLEEWCVPVLSEKEERGTVGLAAAHLYHPLLERPVKNSIDTKNGVLLTGSNASGKSTFLKAVAVNAIFAQTIHTCAASVWDGCYFRILSSMSLRDDLGGKESYYIVEIKALKRILDAAQNPGAPVLAFVDEVLRGTNTPERIAASTQILKSLKKKNAICFAATHDIELTELLQNVYDNYHFQEQIENGDIFFPYLLLEGKAKTRNAIRLLSVMGYEKEITEQADLMAAHFLESGKWQS